MQQQQRITKAHAIKKAYEWIKKQCLSINADVVRNEQNNSRGQVKGRINNIAIIEKVFACMLYAPSRKSNKSVHITRTFIANNENVGKSLPTIDSYLEALKKIGFKISRAFHQFSSKEIGCLKIDFPKEIIEFLEMALKGPATHTEEQVKQSQQPIQEQQGNPKNPLLMNIVDTLVNGRKRH